MSGEAAPRRSVARVVVVGAGIVGLSCAWSLQEHGVDVTVLDRRHVGAGSSWQNAGYVSPAMCVPLPEPSVLRYGVRAVFRPSSPVSVLRQADPRLVRFLAGLSRHCTGTAWARSMQVFCKLNDLALDAFAQQLEGGVRGEVKASDVLCCFEDERQASRVLHEVDGVRASGQRVDAELIGGDDARALEPHLSHAIGLALRVRGQRYLTPSLYVGALAASVRERGSEIVEGVTVARVVRRGAAVAVDGSEGEMDADAVILAAGAWVGPLADPHGVRVPVYGGRGYSFTVSASPPFSCPLYFPAARVATTPQVDRLRVTGIMEFGSPDAPLRPGRFPAMVNSITRLLDGVDWSTRRDEWMGPRPLTTDGLPLVGATRTPGVFVAGGHGMWGVTLGPVTGALLARQIATGIAPSELAPLSPTR